MFLVGLPGYTDNESSLRYGCRKVRATRIDDESCLERGVEMEGVHRDGGGGGAGLRFDGEVLSRNP